MESVEDVIMEEGEAEVALAEAEFEEHSWVQWYQKSWLELEEGANGRLVNPEEASSGKFVRLYEQSSHGGAVRKGLIRFVYLLLDYSESMIRMSDYKPNRCDFLLGQLSGFIPKFFAANPLSYLSIVVMRNGEAELVTRMNGQPNFQLKQLREFFIKNAPTGSCSLVKAFELVLRGAADMPLYASREILVIWGSLSSVDRKETPLNPFMVDKLTEPAHTSVSVNILSLSPEVFAVKKLCRGDEKSKFHVALGAGDFSARLNEWVNPKANSGLKPVYIKMGFPVKTSDGSKAVKCVCHREFNSTVFVCPQCGAFACEIPTTCVVCKLTLVEKDMLTRVHRLLYEMPHFEELAGGRQKCFACNSTFQTGGARCSACSEIFCYECDLFAHDLLKHCPGCV